MTQVNSPSGISAETFFRLLPRALTTLMVRRWFGGRRSGISTDNSPVRYLPVSDFGLRMMSSGVPWATIWPPWMPAPGPMSSTWSASADGVLVMLDHDHGVAEVAQALQRVQQPRIVALVQPDRGLVEHIEHAGQAGADLRGEPDALAFAARQRAGGARERQIIQPDIDQERQPLADLLEHARGDLVLLRVERFRHCRRTIRRRGAPTSRRSRRYACRRS